MTPVLLTEHPTSLLVPAPIEDATRREFITGVGAAALAAAFLAACGEEAEDTAEATETPDAGWPRTIDTPLGPVTIDAKPERVAVLTDNQDLDFVLATGLVPVLYGSTNSYDQGTQPWSLTAGAERAETYDATAHEANVEAVLAARPDLIVGPQYMVEPVYDQLSQIAPTVTIIPAASDGVGWRDAQRQIGRALGREEAAEEAIARTERAFEVANEQITKVLGDSTVTYAYRFQENFNVHGPGSRTGIILTELGLDLRSADPIETEYSLEQIGAADDAEFLLVGVFFDQEQDELEANPLFQRLPAVREGRWARLSQEATRAIWIHSPLSLEWAAPRVAEAITTSFE